MARGLTSSFEATGWVWVGITLATLGGGALGFRSTAGVGTSSVFVFCLAGGLGAAGDNEGALTTGIVAMTTCFAEIWITF